MFSELIVGTLGTIDLLLSSYIPGVLAGATIVLFTSKPSTRNNDLLVLAISLISVLPLLAVLFWFHYPLQQILGVSWPPVLTAKIVLSVFVALNSWIIVQQVSQAVLDKYYPIIFALHLSKFEAIKRIIIPITVYSSLPRLLNLAIVTIHATMFASLIGVDELFRIALRLNAEHLAPVEIFSLMAIFYIALCLPMFLLERYLQNRLYDNFKYA